MYIVYEKPQLEKLLKKATPGVYSVRVEEVVDTEEFSRTSGGTMVIHKKDDNEFYFVPMNSQDNTEFSLKGMVEFFTKEVVEIDHFDTRPGNLTVLRIANTVAEYRANQASFQSDLSMMLHNPELIVESQNDGMYIIKDNKTRKRQPPIIYMKQDDKITQIIPAEYGDWEFIPRSSTSLISEATLRFKGNYSIDDAKIK